jgi:hypothetical protein
VIGDSGEELGEGSDNEEESMVDIVVVGDESVESDACVEVLSRCWCECNCEFKVSFSWSRCCRSCNDRCCNCWPMYAVAEILAGGSTPGLSIVLESISYTDMNEGM